MPQDDIRGISLTTKIFIALIAGILTGAVLNIISGIPAAGEVIDRWLISGFFNIIGQLFISAIKMLVVPLVFTSLICGAAGISDIKKLGRMGGRTVLFYNKKGVMLKNSWHISKITAHYERVSFQGQALRPLKHPLQSPIAYGKGTGVKNKWEKCKDAAKSDLII